jgi:hypothetical protein
MMKKAFVGLAVIAGLGMGLAGIAAAEDQFDLSAGKGEIVLSTKGHWHVNKEYPWKVITGDKTFDKSKFTLTETSAKLTGLPQGTAKLKGAVCDGPQCMPFSKEVTIQ